jgi:peroxiredoxin
VEALKEVGVDEVIVYCVNDAAVMSAWSKDQGVNNNDFITMMGDPSSSVTTALDMEMVELGEGQAEVDGQFGPYFKGLRRRSKRFAMYIKDGDIVLTKVAQALTDPAGDDFPEATLAEALVADIKAM